MENSSSFFLNRDCKYFPCHRMADLESFNCLFCYCPLYALGRDCGGNFVILKNGVKSCEGCAIPHSPGGYEHVMGKMPELIRMVKKKCGEGSCSGNI